MPGDNDGTGKKGEKSPDKSQAKSQETENTQPNKNEEKEEKTTPSGTPTPMEPTMEILQDIVNTIGASSAEYFMAMYHATYDSLRKVKEALNNHDDGSAMLSPVAIGLVVTDLKEIQTNLASLQLHVFQVFKANAYVDDSDLSFRDIALHFYDELNHAYQVLRTHAVELQDKANRGKTNGLKPPKLTVPRFAGNHADWPQFKNNFTNLTMSLPAVDKLRLLQDAVRNHESADSIKDLDITEVNWPIAWSRMLARYDSPREIAHCAIRPLLELPSLMSQSEAGLHKLISTVRTTRHQLEQIKVSGNTEADVLYLHLIQMRLDTRTMNEFNQTLNTSDIPSLEQCIQFIERKAKDVALTREIKQTNPIPEQPRRGRDHERRRDEKRGELNHVQFKGPKESPSQPKKGTAKGPSGSTKPKGRKPTAPTSERKQGTNQYPCLICNREGHRIQACPTYNGMTLPQRKEAVKTSKLCYSCLSPTHATRDCKSIFKCLICGGTHHTTLHQERAPNTVATLFHCATPRPTSGLIPTAEVIMHWNGKQRTIRCMLDSGAQGNFISLSFLRKFGLNLQRDPQNFGTVCHQSVTSIGITHFGITSNIEPEFKLDLEAHVLPALTSQQPANFFDIKRWYHLTGLRLADKNFNQPREVDLLIGQPLIDQITKSRKIPGARGQASAYATHLGYVLMGEYSHETIHHLEAPLPRSSEPGQDDQDQTLEAINSNLEKFWELEVIPPPKPSALWTDEEKFCDEHFNQHTIRLPNGRYQICWPFIKDPSLLGSSFHMAQKRWLSMERKLWTLPELRDKYQAQLQEYLDADRMSEVPIEAINKQPAYYIPHHAVFKPDSSSTKVRIVFDASAKTSSGLSLNSLLPAGPTIQPDLFQQLLHFRENAVALQADITKMYLQIMVAEKDRDFIRILWRPDPSGPIKHYQLNVVPFGVSVSPFLACRTLAQLAMDEKSRFPVGASTLQHRFYVDNLTTSVPTIEAATQLNNELTQLLTSGGFPLCKWASNSMEFMDTIDPSLREVSDQLELDESTTIKALGLYWSPSSDTFAYHCNPDISRKATKRNVLSEISKVFDPLGFLGPVIIRSKILMQKIWTNNIGWDDLLPEHLAEEWITTANNLTHLTSIRIPRALRTSIGDQYELHGFSDASQDAYAACVYLRVIKDNIIDTKLITAKTRVAPLKALSIPRLELQGAVILTELVAAIKGSLSIPITKTYYWTDSAIVLHWIMAPPQKWKTFVRNRVASIQEHSSKSEWAHVISEDNPADCASRGIPPEELHSQQLWWEGPTWLRNQFIFRPPLPGIPPDSPDVELDKKKIISLVAKDDRPFLDQLAVIGSWEKTVRVLARIHLSFRHKSLRTLSPPTPSEVRKAEITLCRLIQQEAFTELTPLEQHVQVEGPVRLKSSVKGLNNLLPTKYPDGIIRVGGRLDQANLPFESRHPTILPGKADLVRSLIMQTHLSLAHAGARVILNHLRTRFWIVNGTKHIKSVIDKCLICFRYKAQPETQLIGQLPSARVNFIRPFLHTGVDLAGPYFLKNFSGRGGPYKAWICLFTCMTTRAIHLEIVSSLSSDGFLLAFRRFIARRGKPSHMHSDNGTNFVGANHHLEDHVQHLYHALQNGHISLPGLELDKIHWIFSPPQGPHHGGTWEICVKLVKQHLKTQCDNISFTWEEFETLLLSVESIVISRPLTPLDDDPQSLEALTPGHFLIGTSLLTIPEADLTHLRLNRLNQYQLVSRRFQELWKRWYRDYLTELQKAQKWLRNRSNLQVGDMVLILDDQVPPLSWRIGRLRAVHPGRDHLVRVATVEVALSSTPSPGPEIHITKKELVRPISKLAKLPIDNSTILPPTKSLTHLHRCRSTPLAHWIIMGVLLSVTPSMAQAPGHLQHEVRWTIAGAALLCAIGGITLNGLAFRRWILSYPWKKQTSTYTWCTLSLHLSDLTIAGFLIPLTASRYYANGWILGDRLCHIYALVLYGSVTWTLLNLILIALFRYLRVLYSGVSNGCLTRAVKISICVLPGLSYLLPTLAYTEVFGRIGVNPHDNSTCTIVPDTNGHTPKPYIWLLGVCIPFTIIYLSTCFIYWTVWRSSRQWLLTPSRQKAHMRLRMVILKVWSSFLLGYQPILVLNLVDNHKDRYHPALHLAALFLAWSTTLLHPLIYRSTGFQSPSSLSAPRIRTASTTAVVNGTKGQPQHWCSLNQRKPSLFSTTTLLIALMACVTPGSPTGTISPILKKLPPCPAFEVPLLPIPACTVRAYWIGVKSDASACLHKQDCLVNSNHYVRGDATGCDTPHRTCVDPSIRLIDNLKCQSRTSLPGNNAVHVALRTLTPDICTVGNIHLHACDEVQEVIQEVPVLLINQIIYPVTELHVTEDALLSDLSSYTCSCNITTCTQANCLGDATFCDKIGCLRTTPKEEPCYCKYANHQPAQAFKTPTGNIYPDCWGHLSLPVKIAVASSSISSPGCKSCTIACTHTGIDVDTPNVIPSYIKVSKNPGHVSITPIGETTSIPLTPQMLISHGTVEVEIWLPNADQPTKISQVCPRLTVCQVISCHLCYDRWVNVNCYGYLHWSLLGIGLIGLITIILVCRCILSATRSVWWCVTWPFFRLWKRKNRARNHQPNDEETNSGIPLVECHNSYRTATVNRMTKRYRQPLWTPNPYQGPLAIILCLITCMPIPTHGCSEFASITASSTECRLHNKEEVCQLQINTRMGISPIGQTSCFRISNQRHPMIGSIEVTTKAVSIRCHKQLLYYVPRAKVNCQSHIQCYSLYSSSACNGDKCQEFKVNDTIPAFESTRKHIGWSSCKDLRYPTCPWWLTRDCLFYRAALVNPTHETYEVFNCPEWQYAVHLKLDVRIGPVLTSKELTLQAGQQEHFQNITFQLISASLPPMPLLNKCFLRKNLALSLSPCNDRGEIAIGRLGEIQCDTPDDAATASSGCVTSRGLITVETDSDGIHCYGNLIDPEEIIRNQRLPLKLENGVLVPNQEAVEFEAVATSLLDVQLTAVNWDIHTLIEESTCQATFIKLEGCYARLPGATLFLEASTESSSTIMASLECPSQIAYTQFLITNTSTSHSLIIHADIPEIDVTCELKCSSSRIPIHINGHLHYLSNTSFRTVSTASAFQPPPSGGMDFHWMSLSGLGIFSWIYRGAVVMVLIIIAGFAIFWSVRSSIIKKML